MKEVFAIIRPNCINQAKKALVAAGLPGFTGFKALGRGSRPVDFEILAAINSDPAPGAEILPTIRPGGRRRPKRCLSIVVPDDRVAEVIETIMSVCRTGQPGDGKVFVLPVLGVVRVRTGESGDRAIDEMALASG